jgi:hypothetical protein
MREGYPDKKNDEVDNRVQGFNGLFQGTKNMNTAKIALTAHLDSSFIKIIEQPTLACN